MTHIDKERTTYPFLLFLLLILPDSADRAALSLAESKIPQNEIFPFTVTAKITAISVMDRV